MSLKPAARRPRNLGRLEEDKVQARLDSPQLIDVSDFAANVKCQGQEPTRSEYSPELREHGLQLGGLEVNDRVEGGYSSEEPIRKRQLSHVALAEFDGGVQFPGQADHLVGDVESTAGNAALAQVSSHVAGPAAQVQNLAGRDALREPVEKRPIERLGFELAINVPGVLGGDEIIRRPLTPRTVGTEPYRGARRLRPAQSMLATGDITRRWVWSHRDRGSANTPASGGEPPLRWPRCRRRARRGAGPVPP